MKYKCHIMGKWFMRHKVQYMIYCLSDCSCDAHIGSNETHAFTLGFCLIHVDQSLAFCVVFCRSLFGFCPMAVLPWLSIIRVTASDYPFSIFKLLFCLNILMRFSLEKLPIRTQYQILTVIWLDDFGVQNSYSKALWPKGLVLC
jgi:hypothetical protein